MSGKGLWRPTMTRGALVLLWSLAWAGSCPAETPGNVVKSLIDEVQRILQHTPSDSPAQKQQRLALIEQATTRHLDYAEMAKRSLGPAWNTISRSQQEEFVQLFSALLKSAYAGRLDEFVHARVVYQSEDNHPDGAEVRILILRQNDRIPVTFRLLREDRGWMVYDLVIEGVSLVANYRSQFSRVIEGSSYQALVRCLQAKVRADSGLRAEAEEDED
jgi:phospholipid transport system substrate-binding protein